MGYQPNEALTLYIVGGLRVTYRDVLVVRSGSGSLVLADNRSSQPLTIAYDPSQPYQDFRMIIERRRSRIETVQRAKEIWSFQRYQRLLQETRQMFEEATTGEGVNRTYPSAFFDSDEPAASFSQHWGSKLNMKPLEPEVVDVTGTSVENQLRPMRGTERQS